jgi:LytR cell envelope-related transcriptional attenuator
VPAAGTGALNGARAGELVRAADVRGDPTTGAGPVRRQQRVLAAVLDRALAPSTLLHAGRVGRLLPALGTTVVGAGSGVDDLATIARTLGNDAVPVLAAPTEAPPDGRGKRVLAEADAAALFAAVRTEGPLPTQDADATTPSSAGRDVTTDVLNASGRDGLAAQVAGTLGELGYRTGQVTTAPQPALDTVIRFSPDRAAQARLLAAAVPSAATVPDPGSSGVLQLVLGRSFDGTVRAATAPAPGGDDTAAAPAADCR